MAMEPRECPKCGLVNPGTALKCDCGYNFITESEDEAIMLGVAGEQRDGKPPLSSTRIITELFLGAVGGFVGLVLDMMVGYTVIAVFGIDEGEPSAVFGIIKTRLSTVPG